jgi:formylglycine-generating enzyme required for sulfatase activity
VRRKRKYPWGDVLDKNKCNTSESGIGGTTPVGKYSPAGESPCGAADMAGNVWEWCSSLYKPYPYRADDGREDLTITGDRVLRGGSWFNSHDFAAAPFRLISLPVIRNVNYGFRVVVVGWRPNA